MKAIIGIMIVVLLSGCATTRNTNGPAGPSVKSDYQEAYEVYPGTAASGISTHFVPSLTTATMVRPLSSLFSLGGRA